MYRTLRSLRTQIAAFFLACIAVFLLFLFFFPVDSYFERALQESTKILDRNGVVLYETLSHGRMTAAPLTEISPHLLQATIAVEDADFFEHSGVDLTATLRAVFQNLKAGRIVSGGSTIPQQLVRNVIGTNRPRTFFQKMKESLLALRISRAYSKEKILELYLKRIYYGNMHYGIGAASRGYFGKSPENLDLAESAFLAGLPQAPNRYNPFVHSEAAHERKNYVLARMREQGLISETERIEAKSEKLHFENGEHSIRAPHFVHYVLQELEERFGSERAHSGLTVRTTLDVHLYDAVQKITRRHLERLAGKNVNNASVVVLDVSSGEILDMLGSADYFDRAHDGEVNVATSLRQPGSAIKPITYALAFEKGWNGATVLRDESVRFFTAEGTPYLPKNYDFEYHGRVTAREALAASYNIPAVLAAEFVGVPALLEKAREMGLASLTQSADHYGLGLTLGDGEVRLLDLTSAYGVFARGGVYRDPISILEVRDGAGDQIFHAAAQTGRRVLSQEASFLVTDILADPLARISEFGLGNVLELDRPAAVKTGTSRNFHDNWTVGYTPDFAVGVWAGNSNDEAMRGVSGIHGAGPIWHDVMAELHRERAVKNFAVPAGVEKRDFCLDEVQSHKSCRKKILEWDFKNRRGEIMARTLEETPHLRIKKPFDRDVFEFLPSLPQKIQQIKFEVENAEDTGEVQWFVDGVAVGKGESLFWPLALGDHVIAAQAAQKKSEEITIHVLEKRGS